MSMNNELGGTEWYMQKRNGCESSFKWINILLNITHELGSKTGNLTASCRDIMQVHDTEAFKIVIL